MNLEKILKQIILVGLYILPFLVFAHFDQLLFPMSTEKGFIFRILIEVIFSAWVLLSFLSSKYRPRITPILVSLSGLMVVALVANIFGVDPYNSFWSNFERMDGYISLLHLFAMFVVLSSFFQTKKEWKMYLHIHLTVAVLASVWGLLQVWGYVEIPPKSGIRITGPLGNAAFYASYLLLNIFISFYYLVETKRRTYARLVYAISFVLMSSALFYSLTRGAILALGVGIFTFSLLSLVREKKGWKNNKRILTFIIIGILLCAGVYLSRNTVFVQDNVVLSRVVGTSLQGGSVQARIVIWDIGLSGIKEKPLLGWGQDNFIYVFNKYYDARMYRFEPWFDRAHNIFIEWFISAGILGLLAYLFVFISIFKSILKKTTDTLSLRQQNVLLSLFIAYLVQSFFVFDALASSVILFSLIAYVTFEPQEKNMKVWSRVELYIKKNIQKVLHKETTEEHRYLYVSILVVVICLAGVVYHVNIKPLLSNRYLVLAHRAPVNLPLESLKLFEDSFTIENFGLPELRERFVYRAQEIVYREDIGTSIKEQYYDLVLKEMDKTIDEKKLLAKYPLVSAYLLAHLGRVDEAVSYYKKAIAISPQKERSYLEYAVLLHNSGRLGEAREQLFKVLELVPNHSEATKLLISGAILEGGEVEEEIFTLVSPSAQVAMIYRERGEIEKMKKEWGLLIDENPDSLQIKITYAQELAKVGEYKYAIEILEEIIKNNPAYKEEIDLYIQQVKNLVL